MPVKSWLRFIVAVTVVVLLAVGAAREHMQNKVRTYSHAKVNDVIMSHNYKCDLGVLYNSDGIPMITNVGNPIECETVELDGYLFESIPSKEAVGRYR